jgi:hypothetical protein
MRPTVVSRHGSVTWVWSKGVQISFARIDVVNGEIQVTNFFRGALPAGSGSSLLAEGLRPAGGHSGSTLSSAGLTGAESLLGRSAANGLAKLGLSPSSMVWEFYRRKLSILVVVG